MANKDKSIDPVLLKSAREQFLAKSFADASVQEICKNAGVTTGALYTRYKGKEELFEAVVEDAVHVLTHVPKVLLFGKQMMKAFRTLVWTQPSVSTVVYATKCALSRIARTSTTITMTLHQ